METVERPRSRKARALEQAYRKPLGEVVRTFGASHFTQQEIADEWTREIRLRCPGVEAVFIPSDVSRLFAKFGVRSYAVMTEAAEAVAS